MKVRVGIDVACRARHSVACADETGKLLWSGHRFRTVVADLLALWAKLPAEMSEVTVVMEPTRNAWVPLAAWFRHQGAAIVMVPPERAADLRRYYSKHAKTDRLDAKLLAQLPLLHPEGLIVEQALGAADALKRAVKIRSGLVRRRSACLHRLDSLLEILGPGWVEALGSDMNKTALRFLARWADPFALRRLGHARLARFFTRSSHGWWGPERAREVMAAGESTIALWGSDGLDYAALAEDIAIEARNALSLTEEIEDLETRTGDLYAAADPAGIVRSAPGVGGVLAAQIQGRLGDPDRFASLAGARSFSGLVPRQDASGTTDNPGGLTKRGDACLREALFSAADHARKIDPTLAARYQRLMNAGKHHNSATCTIAAVLFTRIVACLRNHQAYVLRDIDGSSITPAEGRQIVADRYQVDAATRAARRRSGSTRRPRRDERVAKGVAERSTTTPIPPAA